MRSAEPACLVIWFVYSQIGVVMIVSRIGRLWSLWSQASLMRKYFRYTIAGLQEPVLTLTNFPKYKLQEYWQKICVNLRNDWSNERTKLFAPPCRSVQSSLSHNVGFGNKRTDRDGKSNQSVFLLRQLTQRSQDGSQVEVQKVYC